MVSTDAAPAIVVLTGAGISKESGLATFRCEGGAWQQVRIEDVATPEGFSRNPQRVHDFYNARRAQLAEVTPNAAHLALAELDRHWPGDFLLITQNVDDLHERAGSRRLVNMHGSLRRARCLGCEAVSPWEGNTTLDSRCPACGEVGIMRPDIVWFGEMPQQLERIYAALGQCELFLSIGTSGHVYPAAGFVAEVQGRARTVELNLEPSKGASLFDEVRQGPATELVPEFVAGLLARWR
ncbi:protein-lysine deacetylase/desuccinylase [Rhodovastum atsumiense]|uniref:NAD-dependent protein deacylase n=1 Tax=Rhodovastum atsumiense TaxID=504468 RepID=A0A5M6J225_9PROT|nr:NAD-dependent deacylase [Rhodovastum atsumiense]KAA5613675.1 NAD-dependent deacylase [Rhodovastum atsumiense]CAH2599590.1 protein-lysine deacetylase/desuccinylase [Rhodovastum atsumiense]